MSSKKKDLEIVYDLQWKHKISQNNGDKSNMVGMYDVPATTLNWETFKSYLLKNSGTALEDVKVSYINLDDNEVEIQSQLDFQIALYAFRQRARMGEIITLKLDNLPTKKSGTLKKMKRSTDVEVQVENKQLRRASLKDGPPEWFTKYMKKFKEEIVEEVTSAINTGKEKTASHTRKCKVDCYKRTRKAPLLFSDFIDKEPKTTKLERKLDSKIERLEQKASNVKSKKMTLRVSSDSDVGKGTTAKRHSISIETSSGKGNFKSDDLNLNDTELLSFPPLIQDENSLEYRMDKLLANELRSVHNCMDAALVSELMTIPHMAKGESYMQEWEVINSGTMPWTTETELRYAWGSHSYTPDERAIPCPHLKPKEKGAISVIFTVPSTPGCYESYWHFYHRGRRFGNWLGSKVYVDDSAFKGDPNKPMPVYDIINIHEKYELVLPASWSGKSKKLKLNDTKQTAEENPTEDVPVEKETDTLSKPEEVEDQASQFASCFPPEIMQIKQEQEAEKKENEEIATTGNVEKRALRQLADSFLDLKISVNNALDSDNQSIISISDSTTADTMSSEEFVLVPKTNGVDDAHEQEQVNVLQKITNENNSDKFSIGSVPPGIDELLKSEISEEATAASKNEGNADVEIKQEPNEANKSEGSNDDKSMLNFMAGMKFVRMKADYFIVNEGDLPIDLSNKQFTIETKSQDSEEIEVDGLAKKDSGYAYIHYGGQKIPISKEYLRQDYLANAEEAPNPKVKQENLVNTELAINQNSVKTESEANEKETAANINESKLCEKLKKLENKKISYIDGNIVVTEEDVSEATTRTSTPFNNCVRDARSADNRFFVFPQNNPGYEVVNSLKSSFSSQPPSKPTFGCNYYYPQSGQSTGGTSSYNYEPAYYYWNTPKDDECPAFPYMEAQMPDSPTNIGTTQADLLTGTQSEGHEPIYASVNHKMYQTQTNTVNSQPEFTTGSQNKSNPSNTFERYGLHQSTWTYPTPNNSYGKVGCAYPDNSNPYIHSNHCRAHRRNFSTHVNQHESHIPYTPQYQYTLPNLSSPKYPSQYAFTSSSAANMKPCSWSKYSTTTGTQSEGNASMKFKGQCHNCSRVDSNTPSVNPGSGTHICHVCSAKLLSSTPLPEVMVNDWRTGQNYPLDTENDFEANPKIRINASTGTNANSATSDHTYSRSFEGYNPSAPPSHQSNCQFERHDTTQNSKCSSAKGSSRSSNSSSSTKATTQSRPIETPTQSVPENLLAGAAIVATSAMNTARSVLNMIVPPRNGGNRWMRGYRLSEDPYSRRQELLRLLTEMGFYDVELNDRLLVRYNNDISSVIMDLTQ